MDELFESLLKGIARAIGWFVADFLFNFIFYYIGWPVCKVLSLGKYPKPVTYDYLHTENRQGLFCSFIGFLIVILLFVAWVKLFDSGI